MSLAALAVVLAACTVRPIQTSTPVALRIAGSTSLQPALEELAAAFQASHPNVLIDVRGGGSALGIQQLRDGQIDLAAISWQAEDTKLPEGLQTVPIARDGVAIILHPTNVITNLTSLQLRAIYRGEILDWNAVGSASGMPAVISREEGSGTREAFEALIMGGERVTLNALVLPTGQAIVDYVASHRDAIGYISTDALADGVRVAPVEEVAPTAADILAGTYRLHRVLYLCAAQPAPPEVQAFLDYVLSSSGQAIVANHLEPVR